MTKRQDLPWRGRCFWELKVSLLFSGWSLVFLWCLELGAWCFSSGRLEYAHDGFLFVCPFRNVAFLTVSYRRGWPRQ